MEIILWLFIIILFVLSFVGVFVPIIPSVLVIWVGFILYHIFINEEQLTIFFWLAMIIFTIILLGADFLMNYYFIDKFGGSKWSQWGAVVGVIVGVFIYPPIGILLVPFILVIVIELLQRKSFKSSLFSAIGALAGFLSGAVAKILLQAVMIILFIIAAIW